MWEKLISNSKGWLQFEFIYLAYQVIGRGRKGTYGKINDFLERKMGFRRTNR